MITFEEILKLARARGNSTTFGDKECEAYYNILMSLESHSTIVEIGLQFGCTSAIALNVAKEKSLFYYGVDPFIDPPDACNYWIGASWAYKYPFTLVVESSKTAKVPDMNCVLIDGNHWEEFVKNDIERFASRVKLGGYALFHDYGDEQLPEVYPTVYKYFVRAEIGKDFEELETVGTLGIFRRMR